MTRLIVIALLASACTVTQHDRISVTVWSDDGVEQAYMVVKWEELTRTILYRESERRKFRYQLFAQRADGSDRRALFGEREGRSAPAVYFMRSRGYLVYGKTVPTDTEGLSAMEFRRISTSGAEQSLLASTAAWQPCGAFEAVPSPDGTRIAVVERKPPPGAWAPPAPPPSAYESCQNSDLDVTFFDASPVVERAHFAWTVNGRIDYGWTADGSLFIRDDEHAWRVDPTSGPALAPAPACLHPKTTSSAISSTGAVIAPTSDPDAPVSVRPDSASPFGECG